MDVSKDHIPDRLQEGARPVNAEGQIDAAVEANRWQPLSQVIAPTQLQVGMSGVCWTEGSLPVSNDQIVAASRKKQRTISFGGQGLKAVVGLPPGNLPSHWELTLLGMSSHEGIGLSGIGALICSTQHTAERCSLDRLSHSESARNGRAALGIQDTRI